MTSSIYLFPDTNFFLHCETLEKINWQISEDLTGFDEIHLLLCLPALQEIDDLKYRSTPEGRRANKVYKIARRLITGNAAYQTINDDKPNVRLHEETVIRPSPDLLDYETPDERIVGCAHAYQTAHPEKDVRFLTHDSVAMAIARNANVPFVMVPDQWRKDPPPTAAERENNELKAEIKRLQRTEPRFDVQFLGPNGKGIDKIEGQCLAARSLTDGEITQLLDRLQHRFPNSHTKDWLEDCERVLRNLHTSIQHQSERLLVEIAVDNQGIAPAKDALVEIVGHGPILVGVPLDDDDHLQRYRQKPVRLPSPPSPLDRRMLGSHILSPMDYSKLPPRDPNTFYYKPNRPREPVKAITLECQQSRHESETEYFFAEIYVDSENPVIEGRIECRIHAENLSRPARAFVQVQIVGRTADIAERAAHLVAQVAPRASGRADDFAISPF